MTAQRADFSQALNRREPPEAVRFGLDLQAESNRPISVDALTLSAYELRQVQAGNGDVVGRLLPYVFIKPRFAFLDTTTGAALFRVYAPSGSLTVRADAPDVVDRWKEVSFIVTESPSPMGGVDNNITVTVTEKTATRPAIERLGRRKHVDLIESLKFSGGTSATLRHGYDSPEVTVHYAGIFFDAETGQETSAPAYRGQGVFSSPRPVYGSMLVKYSPEYELCRLNYDIPPASDDTLKAWKIEFITKGEVNLPPVAVTAFSRHGAAATEIPRLLRAYGLRFPALEESAEPGNEERTREYQDVETRRIYADGSSTVYIDVEEPTRMVFTDPATGRKLALNLPPSTV